MTTSFSCVGKLSDALFPSTLEGGIVMSHGDELLRQLLRHDVVHQDNDVG